MIKSWMFWELWIQRYSAGFSGKVLSGDVTGSIHVLEDLITGGRELGQFVSDFTWYMRNLLLVKTSENPEEAIDVSSENLKLLKEESGMTDVETLMRYIRIFSDLSNQIRFASQKRVLVEIALIKLCRPAMETNLDSVLDRLRVLEKQMEERPVQQVIVRESEAGGAGEPGAAVTGTGNDTAVRNHRRQLLRIFRRSWQAGVPSWVRLPDFSNSPCSVQSPSITEKQEIPSFMWNSRIFWG